MVYVALVEAATMVVLVYLFSGILRSVMRANARREDLLLNKALHVAGTPWEPAPADELPVRSLYDEEGELALSQQYARFTSSPEQEP